MTINGHQHFWNPELFPDISFPPAQRILNRTCLSQELKPELERAGVEGTVLVQGLPQNKENNRWLLAWLKKRILLWEL